MRLRSSVLFAVGCELYFPFANVKNVRKGNAFASILSEEDHSWMIHAGADDGMFFTATVFHSSRICTLSNTQI